METVIVAIGANISDRLKSFKLAAEFLASLSLKPIVKSSIWESEPVGPARYTFYNGAAKITTDLSPTDLLDELKTFEKETGRTQTERWGPRVLDLDIIRYGNLVIDKDTLIIPHPEYRKRLFVLKPMLEIDPDWVDISTGTPIQQMVKNAPRMEIEKTDISW